MLLKIVFQKREKGWQQNLYFSERCVVFRLDYVSIEKCLLGNQNKILKLHRSEINENTT